ncbi:MAG: Rne/Rng family ribonuclease [Chitinivibrionales bacterium]
MKRILFNATLSEKRAALMEDSRVTEIVVERPDDLRILGNIYRGKVLKIIPGLQSAFVDIGLEKPGFLHISDVDPAVLLDSEEDEDDYYPGKEKKKSRKISRVPIENIIKTGQELLVQVIKESIGSKSPKITTQLSIAGRFLVLVPGKNFIGVSRKSSDAAKRRRLKKLVSDIKPDGMGCIVRTIGLKVSETEFKKELKSLLTKWDYIQNNVMSGGRLIHKEQDVTTQVIRDLFTSDINEILVDQEDDYKLIRKYLKTLSPDLLSRVHYYKGEEPLFDRFNIESDLEKSLKRRVWLKNGAYLVIDMTEALLAIDVNSGKNTGKKSLQDTILDTNLKAAEEICRQLRLRDIGGLIVVDFIDMRPTRHIKAVEKKMEEFLEKDPTNTSFTKISEFGLMEITRKRVRPELQELFTDVCHFCNGLGRVFSPATVSSRIDRWIKRAVSRGVKGEIILSVHPAVATFLHKNETTLIDEFRREYSVVIDIKQDESLDQDEFEVFNKKNRKNITEKYD